MLSREEVKLRRQARNAHYYSLNKEKMNEMCRSNNKNKYHTDPEYREKKKDACTINNRRCPLQYIRKLFK